jgi:hypothetical protein
LLFGRRIPQLIGFLGLRTLLMPFLAFVDPVGSLLQRLRVKLSTSTLVLVTIPVAILSATTPRITASSLVMHFELGVTIVDVEAMSKLTISVTTLAKSTPTTFSGSFR